MIEPKVVERFVICPSCWESVSLIVDGSGGTRDYVEDCEVCCRPMLVRCVVTDSGELVVSVEGEI